MYTEGCVWGNGKCGDYLVLGNIVYSCIMLIVCFKALLVLDSWNWITNLGIFGSILIWFLFLIVYSYFWAIPFVPKLITAGSAMAGMIELVFSTPASYLCILLIPVIALLPDICFKAAGVSLTPTEADLVRMAEKDNDSEYSDNNRRHREDQFSSEIPLHPIST